jgi:hypothetical protein
LKIATFVWGLYGARVYRKIQVAPEIAVEVQPWRPIFEKCSHLREKGGVLIFSQVCMVGCMGRISHTNLKIRMVISRIATLKNHKELLVPGQICDWIRDPEQILV